MHTDVPSRRCRKTLAQARALGDILANLPVEEQKDFLLGLGATIGAVAGAACAQARIRMSAERLMLEGYHIEAVSVLVAHGLKSDAIHAAEVGQKRHSGPADIAIRLRLDQLMQMAKELP